MNPTEISWTITKDDIKVKDSGRRRALILIASSGLLLLIIGMALYALSEWPVGPNLHPILEEVLIYGCTLSGVFLLLTAGTREPPSKFPTEQVPVSYTISSNGITIDSAKGRSDISWDQVRSWETVAGKTNRSLNLGRSRILTSGQSNPYADSRFGNLIYIYLKTNYPWSTKVTIRTKDENQKEVISYLSEFTGRK